MSNHVQALGFVCYGTGQFAGLAQHSRRHYTFNESDWALIRQRRGNANRLGFAVQLCLLRYPCYALAANATVTESVIHWIAGQIKTDPGAWLKYGEHDE